MLCFAEFFWGNLTRRIKCDILVRLLSKACNANAAIMGNKDIHEGYKKHKTLKNSLLFIFCLLFADKVFSQVPPVANADQFFNVRTKGTYNLLSNQYSPADNDPGNLAIAISEAETDKLSANGASIKIISTTTVEYYPNPLYAGWDSFSYVIFNTAGLKDTAKVKVFIISGIKTDSVVYLEGSYIDIPILKNDVITSRSSVAIKTIPALKYGTAVLNAGVVRYTPSIDFIGVEDFNYTICDTFDATQDPICKDGRIYLDRQEIDLKIPAGISPNGDGNNDMLVINNIKEFPNSVLTVYNRLGDEVWKSGVGYNNDFSGKNNNGDDLPPGTYYYLLELNRTGYFKNRASSLTIQR